MKTIVAGRSAERRPTSGSTSGRAVLALIAIGGLLAGGVVLALRMARTDQAQIEHNAGHAVGETVKASFGFVTVANVDHIGGLTQQDLSSASHGISGLVEAGKEQLQVTLELTSDLGTETAPYTPEQFSLLVDGDAPQAPVTTTIHAGRLQPFASVQGHLGFVVPTDGRAMTLRFNDAVGEPILVDLGHAGVANADSTSTHH